jgi:hypothetical protein
MWPATFIVLLIRLEKQRQELAAVHHLLSGEALAGNATSCLASPAGRARLEAERECQP